MVRPRPRHNQVSLYKLMSSMLTKEQFMLALGIISANHTTQVVLNKPRTNFVGGLGQDEFSIHIQRSCAAVINNLKQYGYSLSMEEHGLCVDYFGNELPQKGAEVS